MSKSRRLLVGVLSFLPLILLIGYIIVFFNFILHLSTTAQPDSSATAALVIGNMFWIVIVAVIMGFSTLGLLIYFIIHAVNNQLIDSTERIIWILVFIFAGMIAFPIYWYLRIWKDQPAALIPTNSL